MSKGERRRRTIARTRGCAIHSWTCKSAQLRGHCRSKRAAALTFTQTQSSEAGGDLREVG